MGSFMLLHVVFARKGFVACWAKDVLFSRMFLSMTGGVARSSKGVPAGIASSVWTRVFFLGLFGR